MEGRTKLLQWNGLESKKKASNAICSKRSPSKKIHLFAMLAGLQLLASLTGLDKLEVSCQEPFTDRGISHLCHLTALTDLVFSSNQAELKVGSMFASHSSPL